MHDTVVYEVHIKGFTAAHPDIPSELRGTYAGLAHPAATGYLSQLGISAVELLPVQQFCDPDLQRRGLSNYTTVPAAVFAASAPLILVRSPVNDFA